MSLQDTLQHWGGHNGHDYAARNVPTAKQQLSRKRLWQDVRGALEEAPHTVLEVGAGAGQNLAVWKQMDPLIKTGAVEPNDRTRKTLITNKLADVAKPGTANSIDFDTNSFDLVFTSGVLIHIPPDDLEKSCEEIYRVSKKYIVSVEYFAAAPEEKQYRGQQGLLWKRDFGKFWMENFSVKPLFCGFYWKCLTDLDDLTVWVMQKC